MNVDIEITSDPLRAAADAAAAEQLGFEAGWVAETGHDPFLSVGVAAGATERLGLGTGIAVAFARSPMVVAGLAWDLHRLSRGRFRLGLGSQTRTHIERRFSMPWSQPARRMREYVAALHAIWDAWQHDTRLDFRGDFTSHTLMTPYFSPGPSERGRPPVVVAAVGPEMTRVACEVAEGLLVHPLTTPRYLEEVTLPLVEESLWGAGRGRHELQLSCPVLVATGESGERLAEAVAAVRRQLAFYASTPGYRAVLELHGWGDLQTALAGAVRRGGDAADLVDDEVLDAFAVVAEPDDVAAALTARFGGRLDRVTLHAPYPVDRQLLAGIARTVRDAALAPGH